LKYEGVGLLCVVFEIAGAGVLLVVTRIKFNLLTGELVLLCLELEEFLAVHHSSSAAPTAGTTGRSGRQRSPNARHREQNSVQPRLRLSLRTQAFGRLHSSTEEENTIRALRTGTPALREVRFDSAKVERAFFHQ
jgi:hypothetical protein